MSDTVFHKIIRKELPARVEYEDDDCIVIHDIAPKAPVHLLVIPKQDIEHFGYMTFEDHLLVGKLIYIASQMAHKLGIQDAFRLVINNGGVAGQVVMQAHIHLLGGWTVPPHDELDV